MTPTTDLDLDAIEAHIDLAAATRHSWADETSLRDVNVIAGLRRAKELAVDIAPALVAEVRRMRTELEHVGHALAALDAWGQGWHRRIEHGASPAQANDIALLAAYDALPNDQEPCGICAGNGCPDCRDDEPIDPLGAGWTQGDNFHTKSPTTENHRVIAFNAAYPIGTPVHYWKGVREGTGKVATTRTAAQLLGGHTAVVWLNGVSGCIALTHIEPVNTTGLDAVIADTSTTAPDEEKP